jgi:hypothetical protein
VPVDWGVREGVEEEGSDMSRDGWPKCGSWVVFGTAGKMTKPVSQSSVKACQSITRQSTRQPQTPLSGFIRSRHTVLQSQL